MRLGAVRRLAYEAADRSLLSADLAPGIRRVRGVKTEVLHCRNLTRPEIRLLKLSFKELMADSIREKLVPDKVLQALARIIREDIASAQSLLRSGL